MRKIISIITIICFVVSLFTGCDELFDANMQVARDPYIPITGTPVPAPNAPLPDPTATTEPTETPIPVTSTNPKPAPTDTPTQNPTPTPVPTQTPTNEPVPSATPVPTTEPPIPTLIPPVEYIPKLGVLIDSSDNATNTLSMMAFTGLQQTATLHNLEAVHLKVPAMDTGTILAHIDILVTDECEVIILPGQNFAHALESAQTLYPETLFVLLDYDGIFADNVVSVLFSEFQAGFLAGVASAYEMSIRLGQSQVEFGIIIEENTVTAQLYATGFTEGLLYVSNMYGLNPQLPEQYIVYLESIGDPEEALYAAYGLYDSGVSCILNLAGSSASQVIQAAIDANNWELPAYIVGVEYNSYLEGLLPGGGSVVLTSAMNFYDVAVIDIATAYAGGDFAGGTQLIYDFVSGGIGLPPDNTGLSEETIEVLLYIYEQMELNWLQVPPLGDGPIAILAPPPPIPSEIPTLEPSEIPTLPPEPSETPTIPPMP